MDGQQNNIKEFFDRNGWEVVEIRKIDDIAVVELWLIRSTWSPTDCFQFFSFQTDPQNWYLQRQGEKPRVHRVVATLKKPLDWMAESVSEFEKNEVFNDSTDLYFNGHFKMQMTEFFADLAKMRQKFQSFYG